jgi:hypothetical protein
MHLVVEKTHVNKLLIQPNGMINLSVEGTFMVCIPIDIMLHNHKIRCRSAQPLTHHLAWDVVRVLNLKRVVC